MSDRVEMIEYQLVRPDGTVLFRHIAASTWHVDFGSTKDGRFFPMTGDWIGPPWQLRARRGSGDWEILQEFPTVGG